MIISKEEHQKLIDRANKYQGMYKNLVQRLRGTCIVCVSYQNGKDCEGCSTDGSNWKFKGQRTVPVSKPEQA